jgi:hypothetical protein
MIFKVTNKQLEFDQQLWLHNREQRIFMISSLLRKQLLNGLTKEEVVNLLGFEFNDKNSTIWTYYIGKRGFLFSMKSYLYIYFDGFGRVYKIAKK